MSQSNTKDWQNTTLNVHQNLLEITLKEMQLCYMIKISFTGRAVLLQCLPASQLH